jgi:hypothetical protein
MARFAPEKREVTGSTPVPTTGKALVRDLFLVLEPGYRR